MDLTCDVTMSKESEARRELMEKTGEKIKMFIPIERIIEVDEFFVGADEVEVCYDIIDVSTDGELEEYSSLEEAHSADVKGFMILDIVDFERRMAEAFDAVIDGILEDDSIYEPFADALRRFSNPHACPSLDVNLRGLRIHIDGIYTQLYLYDYIEMTTREDRVVPEYETIMLHIRSEVYAC